MKILRTALFIIIVFGVSVLLMAPLTTYGLGRTATGGTIHHNVK